LPGFAVFPSAEAAIGRAEELGFAGCISATANVTGPFAQAALGAASEQDRAAGLAEAVRIRTEIARFPLVASVKETLALTTGATGWRRLMPPLIPLGEEQRSQLAQALGSTALGAVAAACNAG
jgi:4-hydroxy-tetrahydrodipicolinate synthase